MNTDELSSLLFSKALTKELSLEFIVDKSWMVTKKQGGYGKIASFTLSYLRMMHSQMLGKNQRSFCISSETIAKAVGVEAKAVRKAVKMFASKGFFTLKRKKAFSEKTKTHWVYTPESKFPSFQLTEFWRIPRRLILSVEDGGFGIPNGTLLAVLLNIVIATKFPSVLLSNRELASMIGVDKSMIGLKLQQFEQLNLIKQGDRKVIVMVGEVCDWLVGQQTVLTKKTRRELWKARNSNGQNRTLLK